MMSAGSAQYVYVHAYVMVLSVLFEAGTYLLNRIFVLFCFGRKPVHVAWLIALG